LSEKVQGAGLKDPLPYKKEKVMRLRFLILTLLFLFLNLSLLAQRGSENLFVIEHNPVVRFTHGESIEIRGALRGDVEWMRFYFRYEGISQFQVREMEKENGTFFFLFETSTLPGLQFEYYLSAKVKDRIINYPADAPLKTVKVIGESEEVLPEIPQEIPPPEEEEKRFHLPLSVNGSIQSRIAEKEEIEGEKKTNASGNLRVYHTYQKEGELSFEFDSNFNYTNIPQEGEKKFDLSNMVLSLSKDNHNLKAGDININESEYTVSGLGRRGVEYTFNNQKAYIHIFDVSSQQPKGFKGFGIPKSNISIYGGAIGYNFLDEKISLKAIYIGGKDDPNEGINTGSSPYYQSRKGNVIAIVEETRLFENKLNLKAEFAKSKYDGELTDDVPSKSDNAYQIGAGLNIGGFQIGALYKYTGKDFNPIGFQSFTSDRKGYQATAGFTKGILNLTGSYIFERDNVKGEPTQLTTKNGGGNLSIALTFSPKVSLNLGYKRDKQKTVQNETEVSGQDSLTNEYSSSLTLNLNESSSLNITFTNSSLSSKSSPESETSAFTLNIGGAFRKGEKLTLNPTIGYSKTLNRFTDEESIAYNTLLTGEIAFIPRIFSLIFSGSFNRSETLTSTTDTFDTTGGLNLYLDRIIKFGSIILSAKGSYNLNKVNQEKLTDYKVFIQLDFSF
jgi:hypothetical protein